jgi:alpha-D-ribose 1-methylphosphonate 5-triphosphate synthase subunit PhnG
MVEKTVSSPAPATTARQRWMGVLAKARPAELTAAWDALGLAVAYDLLRAPEVGMAMVRARAGGDGAPFNFGEMTMTRCAVRLASDPSGEDHVGFGYVAGRDRRHAELAALCDALLQDRARHDRLMAAIVAPLAEAQAARRDDRARRAAATRVDFFTLVRGDNPR